MKINFRNIVKAAKFISKINFRNFYDYYRFDPIFYHEKYDDLKSIKNSKRLFAHFVMNGAREGRFSNEISFLSHRKSEFSKEKSDFDVSAYKYYNTDLLGFFKTDDDFLTHYVRHGEGEGRRASFACDGISNLNNPLLRTDLWKCALHSAHVLPFVALGNSSDVQNRDDVIFHFSNEGIEQLCPIKFGYEFDPKFYRLTSSSCELQGLNDAELYRHWLNYGFPSGEAPNENLYLYEFLAGAPYPKSFDWQGYGVKAGLGKNCDRLSSLKHLFQKGGSNLTNSLEYMGSDAPNLLWDIGRYRSARGQFKLAARAFEEANARRDSPELLGQLGDCYWQLGRKDDALRIYSDAINRGPFQISPYLHSIDIHCSDKNFEDAFALLRRLLKRGRGNVRYDQAFDRCVDLYFQHQSALAHALFRQFVAAPNEVGVKNAANSLLLRSLETIKALYLECDLLPARISRRADGHVLMLANDDLPQCNHYRIEQKKRQFEAAGIALKVISHRDVDQFAEELIGAQGVIFYRVAATPGIIRAIIHADQMGLPTYYEIDDLIFDPDCYPDSFASYDGQVSLDEYAGLHFGVPLFRFAMSLCQNRIASTSALLERMQGVTGAVNGLVVRNGLDDRNNAAIQMGANPKAKSQSGKIRVFYGSATKAHNSDFNEIVGPALVEIMKANVDVELVVAGYINLSEKFEPYTDQIKTYPFTSDVEAYWSLLGACDISIAVLHPGAMTDCKSEIKWLEAAVLRVPSVVSDTATYREVINHGRNGYIASNTSEWKSYLADLIEDFDRRERMGAEARADALAHYGVDEAAKLWTQEFAIPSVAIAKKRRVLICNVFFYPQSIGGATRVVEDNVKYFAENCADLEIGVFCTDEGGTKPGHLRVTSFKGCPVYRVSVPLEEHMDWKPFSAANAEIFARVLDDFKPDLIHFHCIQRLSATIVEVALQRRVPYVVTLHDAWWISDYQFLVDEDGFLRMPTTDVLGDVAHRRASFQSIERRQRLTALLQGASARLSVSQPFARVHEDAGIKDVTVIENGVSALPRMPKILRPDGRLALAHIGGRASHKGAFLLQAALSQEQFSNLHLTMVDGYLGAGQVVEAIWGTTPVTLMGPQPQAEMSELYSRINVLLAPSTWPESFGLVTREALMQGCWVVASDLGAIGQGVQNGKNGFVIDTKSSADIKRILHVMDVDFERYKASPDVHGPPLRVTDAQARELGVLYSSLI